MSKPAIKSDSIDSDGFRRNVCIVIHNAHGQVLWARRSGLRDAWQFPQGGMRRGESAQEAMYRELYEEVGLKQRHVEVVAYTRSWLRYRLPAEHRGKKRRRIQGQKQRWFLLRLTGNEDRVRLDRAKTPEFDAWRWVSYWYPVGRIVDFKRDVYRQALKTLAPSLAAP